MTNKQTVWGRGRELGEGEEVQERERARAVVVGSVTRVNTNFHTKFCNNDAAI